MLFVVLAIRALGGDTDRGSGAGASAGGPLRRSRARELLNERFARGELSAEEYRERLQTLGEDR